MAGNLNNQNQLDENPQWRSISPDRPSPSSSPGLGVRLRTETPPDFLKERRSVDIDFSQLSLASTTDGPQLFQPLSTDDPEERTFAAKAIVSYLASSFENFKANYALVLRYAHECPFEDLRQTFQALLDSYKDKQLPYLNLRCSLFIPQQFIPKWDNPELQEQFEEIFLQSGRVSHLDRVIALHPTYLEKAYQTYSILIQGPGPLTKPERLYLGILSAARFECQYIVDMIEMDFLMAGGDPSWLQGTHAISTKLKSILEINSILAHRPWLIRPSHFEVLIHSKSWSVAELIQACLIMTTTRSIAGTVLGCGVCPELDRMSLQEKIDAAQVVPESPPPEPEFAEETQKLEALLQSDALGPSDMADIAARLQEFEKIATETETPPAFDHPELSLTRYNECSSLRHVDFEVKGNKLLHVQDFSWAEQGFETINRYFPKLAGPLDEQFNHIYNLTYNSFNEHENIDTFPYRRALWFYVQRVKGVFYDDYNYPEVNLVLNRNTKSFIKKISCFPATVNQRDFNNLGVKLQPSEKVHIVLLASEASKQAELLWALDALSQVAQKN